MGEKKKDYFEEWLDERFKNITTSMNGQFIQVNEHLSNIDEHLRTANGNVKDLKKEVICLQTESDKRKLVVDDFRTLETKIEKILKWFKLRWVWLILGLFLFIVVVHMIIEFGLLGPAIREIWEKIF